MQIFSFELQKWTTAIWNYKTFHHLENGHMVFQTKPFRMSLQPTKDYVFGTFTPLAHKFFGKTDFIVNKTPQTIFGTL